MGRLPLVFVLARNALTPPIVTDALKTGLFVGLLLNLINNGGAVLDGEDINWGNVVLDFIVPFCVSAYSGTRGAYAACGSPGTEQKPSVS